MKRKRRNISVRYNRDSERSKYLQIIVLRLHLGNTYFLQIESQSITTSQLYQNSIITYIS